MAPSDDKKDFTTLGIGSGSEPNTGSGSSDIDTPGTLGLGAIPLKSAGKPRASTPEEDTVKKTDAPPALQNERAQELRRQRNAQIQAALAQAESALADDRLEAARTAIEQAFLLSPDNPKVLSVLQLVEQREQARVEAERARKRAEEARREAERADAVAAAAAAAQAPQRDREQARAENAAGHGVESSGAAGLLFASGDGEPQPGHGGQSSIADLRLGDVRVLAGLGVVGVIMVVLVASLFLGGADGPPVTASDESVPPPPPSLPPEAPVTDAGEATGLEAPPDATPRRSSSQGTSRSFREASRTSPPARPAPVERAAPRADPPAAASPAEPTPPRPAEPELTESDGPVRIAGDIQRPIRTTNVPPTYPVAAREAGVRGIVVLETVISAAGQVTDVKVLLSVDPLLDAAALAAARQWAYTPTIIDGTAVPVVMTETVRFMLDGATEDAAPAEARSSPQARSAPAQSGSTGAVRIAGDIPRPTRTANVAPSYPEAAREARISGVVILETEISETGQVTSVKVLRSADPTLDQAAVDAARQWVYTPTVLDGRAVAVVMSETVNFVLPPSMEDIDPRTLLGLSMEQVRNRVGTPEVGDDTTWTYQTRGGRVTLTFESLPDGSPADARVSRVESPQGTVRRLPR